MGEKVRVGVIGTSGWATGMHLTCLKTHPRAEVCAVCGRDRERAQGVAAQWEVPRVFTDYREMIEQSDLDAVVIVTPDDMHHPMAMDAGLHVLCEKPLALNARQAQQMYEKALAAGVKHMVYMTYRWLPLYRYLKELVDSGYIGRCFHCSMRYLGGWDRGGEYGWRFDRRRTTGVLGDAGSHMIDMARWCVDDIARVSAILGAFVDRPGPDGRPLDPANDSAMLLLQFENGAQGTIQVSAMAHIADRGQEQRLILHGAAGTLETSYTWEGSDSAREVMKTPVEIRGARQDEASFHMLPIPDRLLGGLAPADSFQVFTSQSVGDRAFIDAIMDDLPLSPSFYDGWKAQQVIDAAIESHQEGRWVAV